MIRVDRGGTCRDVFGWSCECAGAKLRSKYEASKCLYTAAIQVFFVFVVKARSGRVATATVALHVDLVLRLLTRALTRKRNDIVSCYKYRFVIVCCAWSLTTAAAQPIQVENLNLALQRAGTKMWRSNTLSKLPEFTLCRSEVDKYEYYASLECRESTFSCLGLVRTEFGFRTVRTDIESAHCGVRWTVSCTK